MTAARGSEKLSWFVSALSCLAFSFFWGNNTVVFSSLLLSDNFEALIQMLWRSLFLVIFAVMFYSLKKVPLPIIFSMLGLQVGVLIYEVITGTSDALPGPVLIIVYSCYMSFFLLCFIAFFFSFPKKSAVILIGVSLLGSYVVSTLLYEFSIPSQIRSLLNLCATFTICFCLQSRSFLSPSSPSSQEEGFPVSSLRQQLRSFTAQAKLYFTQRPIVFGGSVALLLLVFEIWFQLNNSKTSTASEFSTALFGILCIAAIVLLFVAFKISEEKTIRFFPAVSLVAFLASQIAVLLFWENTLFIMAIFTGTWFAMYQLVLLLYCRAATDRQNSVGFATAFYGVILSATMLALVLGNGFARFFLWDLTLDYSVLSTLAFTMTVILVVAFAIEITLYFRQLLKSKQKSSRANDELRTQAIDSLCERFQISPREREVMEIYVQGRSVNYIAEHLVVSSHTVKTHVRRLYAKLDIHSKEDLFDLIEENKQLLQQ